MIEKWKYVVFGFGMRDFNGDHAIVKKAVAKMVQPRGLLTLHR